MNTKIKNDLTIKLGKRIAKIRKELKLTQEDVEERSIINGEKTIKYKTLSLIEQGYGEPKITTINLIAEALGVNISYLLNFENDKINVSKQDLINDIIHHNVQNRKIAIIENGSWACCCGDLIKDYLSKLKNIDFIGEKINIKSSLKKLQEDEIKLLAKELL